MTSAGTPAPVVSAEDMPLREALARWFCKREGYKPDLPLLNTVPPKPQWKLYLKDADALLATDGPLGAQEPWAANVRLNDKVAKLEARLAAMQAEHQRTVERTRCPIGISPESRSICSAGTCYDCLADRCVWSSDLRKALDTVWQLSNRGLSRAAARAQLAQINDVVRASLEEQLSAKETNNVE